MSLTSILQICDILVNKPLKALFKKQYCSWKIKNDPDAGVKYKFARDLVITWLENATVDVRDKMKDSRKIERAFQKFSQDYRFDNVDELMIHLAGLNENSVYASLQENQEALSI